MQFTNENKLEKLEKKVQELERKLQEKTSKDEATREMQARLAGYQDMVRSDKGDITLKKNFVIKSRKGKRDPEKSPGIDPQRDNVATFSFNDRESGRLNHIFIGDASLEGGFRNSVLGGTAIVAEDVDKRIPNNGKIQFKLAREDDLDKDGVMKAGTLNNIDIFTREGATGDTSIPGDMVSIIALREGGEVNLYYLADDWHYHRLAVGKNGVGIGQGNGLVDGGIGPVNKVLTTKIDLADLPTTDPSEAGAIWNDSGTLKISLG